jgi:membrane protease YdiL (CAAX protease family)
MHAYAVAIAVAYALGASWLAGIAVARSRRLAAFGFLPLYAGVLALICGFAVPVLAPPLVVSLSSRDLGVGLLVGALAGVTAIKAEDELLRRARRRARQPLAAVAGPAGLRPPGPRQTLALLVVIAVLEEILFRGVLLDLAISMPGEGLRIAAVAALALAFAATHIAFGWTQVVAKLPLSLTATAAALTTGSVVGAVVAHGLVNTRSWHVREASE